MMDELRKNFHHDLDDVRSELVHLAAFVTEAIPRATNVLLTAISKAPTTSSSGDDEIDARSLDLEERCLQILALQAPVATDLRQIVAALRMVAEVERSADLRVQHLQGGAPHLRPRARPEPARHHHPDGRAGPAALHRRDRVVRRERRGEGGGDRRHGQLPRRAAEAVRPGDLREPLRRHASTCRWPSSSRSSPGSTSASATTP